jgi:hypothetical protein
MVRYSSLSRNVQTQSFSLITAYRGGSVPRHRLIWNLSGAFTYVCTSRGPRGLRDGSAAAYLLGLRVRIPPLAWMSVCCECCALSGRCLCVGLITRPEESYPVWCVWVWSWNLWQCRAVENKNHCYLVSGLRMEMCSERPVAPSRLVQRQFCVYFAYAKCQGGRWVAVVWETERFGSVSRPFFEGGT